VWVNEEAQDEDHEGQQLKKEGFSGLRPMDDQKEELDDGNEKTGQPPKDTFPESSNQKPKTAEKE
jgi:hypothetical protein